ncbi:hypothetical protein M0802_012244 [Mischocyttarus mexicanus]|nr:hypothetical protein M0802_012244 [Mischocyttarus mexicanus]
MDESAANVQQLTLYCKGLKFTYEELVLEFEKTFGFYYGTSAADYRSCIRHQLTGESVSHYGFALKQIINKCSSEYRTNGFFMVMFVTGLKSKLAKSHLQDRLISLKVDKGHRNIYLNNFTFFADIMFLSIFLSFIVLLIAMHCKNRYGRLGRILNRLPEPKSYPIIGNLVHFYFDRKPMIQKLWQLDDIYFPIYKLWTFMYYFVFLLHPDDIKVLMLSTDHIGKEEMYSFLRPWLSYGLLTSTGKKWQIRRKMLTPAFHFRILKHNVITFNKEANCLVESLKQEMYENAIVKDLVPFITQHTLNIICETAMGTSLKEKKELESKYRASVHTFGEIVTYRMRSPWYNIPFLFALSSFGRLQKRLLKTLHSFSEDGHDTTAMALVFALSLFAKHQDVQQRVRDEVSKVMIEDDYKLTISDLQDFSYLDRCIKESLRLYPSVHIISRTLTSDLQLDNYLVPADTICVVNIYSLHRNPRYWPNPNVFDPDRFLPENVKQHYPFSYIPFSVGPRNCIGQKFAMLEIKLIVAYILRNFYVEPVDNIDDVKMATDITLIPSKPLRVRFIPVK